MSTTIPMFMFEVLPSFFFTFYSCNCRVEFNRRRTYDVGVCVRINVRLAFKASPQVFTRCTRKGRYGGAVFPDKSTRGIADNWSRPIVWRWPIYLDKNYFFAPVKFSNPAAEYTRARDFPFHNLSAGTIVKRKLGTLFVESSCNVYYFFLQFQDKVAFDIGLDFACRILNILRLKTWWQEFEVDRYWTVECFLELIVADFDEFCGELQMWISSCIICEAAVDWALSVNFLKFVAIQRAARTLAELAYFYFWSQAVHFHTTIC